MDFIRRIECMSYEELRTELQAHIVRAKEADARREAEKAALEDEKNIGIIELLFGLGPSEAGMRGLTAIYMEEWQNSMREAMDSNAIVSWED